MSAPQTALGRLGYRCGLIALCAALLGTGGLCRDRAVDVGAAHRLTSPEADAAAPPQYVLLGKVLGGLRGVLTTSLWMRAQALREEGRLFEMVDVYRSITYLQPRHALAWCFQAWDLAYNVSLEAEGSAEDRAFWVFRAIDLLRHEGLVANPGVAEIPYQLGWIFHHKIGAQTDDAHRDFKRALKEEVSACLGPITPERWHVYEEIAALRRRYPDRAGLEASPEVRAASRELASVAPGRSLFDDERALLAERGAALVRLRASPAFVTGLRQVSLWRIGADLKERLALDPARMHALSARTGPIDWRLAEAQAYYWGTWAEELHEAEHPDRPVPRYNYLVNHSLMRLVYSGDSIQTAEGSVFFVPNYRFLEATLDRMDGQLRLMDEFNDRRNDRGLSAFSVDGVKAGYRAFLGNMALNAALDEQRRLAEGLLLRKLQVEGAAGPRAVDLDGFVARELRGRLSVLGSEELLTLINVFIVRAARRLSVGDSKGYQRREAWARRLHTRALALEAELSAGKPEGSRRPLPGFRAMVRATLTRIVAGGMPGLSDTHARQTLLAGLRSADPKLYNELRARFEGRPASDDGPTSEPPPSKR